MIQLVLLNMSLLFPFNLSIIIPVKRDDPFIERCVRAVVDACRVEYEVIIVLDGWETGRLETLTETGRVSVLSHAAAGPAACRDFGARLAANEWLCFLDADVLVRSDSFDKAIASLSASADDGLIGSYDQLPEANSTVSRFRNLLHHYHHQRNHGRPGVFWGAFGIVRRSAYFGVGGFDTSFRSASVEDIELGYRLAEHGYVVRIRSEVQVCHLKRWTLKNMIHTDIFLRAKPWSMLMHRYRRWKDRPLNTSAREQLSAAFACLTPMALTGLLITKWALPVMIISLICFLLVQSDYYRFVRQHFSLLRMPQIVVLHHIYFCSAALGWILAKIDHASVQKQFEHG
jgi:cellulose synthase/poly-beta-1,6-N-acetylglucosamine synthase-like glycosyltransferase